MSRIETREAARLLIATRGDRGATTYETTLEVECYMANDMAGGSRWRAVSAELRFLIRPPQTGMGDIYRTA